MYFSGIQGGPKSEAANSWPYFCQILTDSQNFFTRIFLGKFAVHCLLKKLAYVATLPCENIKFRMQQVINDKLQVSVATYLRYSGVVNNRIKIGLLLSLSVKNLFKIGEYWTKL